MAYKLNITERADELLDNLMQHLLCRLKNEQAAKHLLNCIDAVYDRLEDNPFQFPECKDAVSYTHLTMPTNREVEISVVAE